MFSCKIFIQYSVGTLRELLTGCGIIQSFKKIAEPFYTTLIIFTRRLIILI